MNAFRLLAPLAAALMLGCSAASGPGDAAPAPPDLSGVWMAFAVENPDGGGNTPAYSDAGKARLDAFASQFRSIPETGAWCLGTGMPGVMMSLVTYPIQVVQTPNLIVMLAELEMQLRRVYLDGREHAADLLPSTAGHSTGTWEGNTLVIDTALLSEWQVRPWPRSEQTHVTERVYLTRLGEVKARASGFIADSVRPPVNDDVLVVELTLTDPTYYDGPQRRNIYFQRMDDSATLEYLCTTEHWVDALEKQRIKPEVL
ncbi:MAG: hypothetical protein M3Y79_06650 [Pseudomonadota bacterium]|nr:hypothetical protein [Pseudomonadota bacterium]